MTDLTNPNYRPGDLLDVIQDKLDLKNDAALARALDTAPGQISKMRNKKLVIGATMLVVLSEAVDLSIGQLRHIAGLPRRMYTSPRICR
jgi:plasmid maintenance system antidote protein VapI